MMPSAIRTRPTGEVTRHHARTRDRRGGRGMGRDGPVAAATAGASAGLSPPAGAATLLAAAGDNPDRLRSAASFAALCGTSPIDASSGRQQRHRLNRGGDRQANSALYNVVIRPTPLAPADEELHGSTAHRRTHKQRGDPLPEALRRTRSAPSHHYRPRHNRHHTTVTNRRLTSIEASARTRRPPASDSIERPPAVSE